MPFEKRVPFFRSISLCVALISLIGCKRFFPQNAQEVASVAKNTETIEQWLSRPHQIDLDIYAPPNTPEMLEKGGLRWYTPERLQVLLTKSSQCLNNAFAAAGYTDTQFEFRAKRVTHLEDEVFAKLPSEPWDLPFDHTGELIKKRGCDTKNYPLYFAKKVSQPIFVNPKDSDAISRAHEWKLMRACVTGEESACKEAGVENLTECQFENKILDYAENIHSKSPTAAAMMLANDVFNLPTELWGDAYSKKLTEKQITDKIIYDDVYFVHEFLHVYGGLSDRYHNRDFYDQTNIMGNADEFTCKLTADQVLSIFNFRNTCKIEVLEQGRPTWEPCTD